MKKILHIPMMIALLATTAGELQAQYYNTSGTPAKPGSRNMELLSHIPLGGAAPRSPGFTEGIQGLGRRTADVEIEQELSRPYVYVSSRFSPSGFYIISVEDPDHARIIGSWMIDDPELHLGSGALDGKYFKLDDRYYYVQSFQFRQGGPDSELGAIVFDVTGLPDASEVHEVARIEGVPGGFHNIFMYKHSDGRALLFATGGSSARVYDMAKVVEGEDGPLVGQIPTPDWANEFSGRGGYHDFFVGFHPATQQDRFYGAGAAGYHVYDVTNVQNPVHLASIQSSSVRRGHTITPSPDGRYVVTEVEYRGAPLRIFDLQPVFDGTVDRIRTAVGAWTANWRNFSHNHEVRWPYVFVAALDDGLQIFNMRDPTNPYTVGYYDTWLGPDGSWADPATTFQGAWGVDVRNADGLIVVSSFNTGFWAFRIEGFQGWSGDGWGVPNVSSVQDWDNGPAGVRRDVAAETAGQ